MLSNLVWVKTGQIFVRLNYKKYKNNFNCFINDFEIYNLNKFVNE